MEDFKQQVADSAKAQIAGNSYFQQISTQAGSTQEQAKYHSNLATTVNEVSAEVGEDLDALTALFGQTSIGEEKSSFELMQQQHAQKMALEEKAKRVAELAFPIRAYKKCLELDIQKWKLDLALKGRKPVESKVDMSKFVRQEDRDFPMLKQGEGSYGSGPVEEIIKVQVTLNYWRSAYKCIPEYEQLLGKEPRSVEKAIWALEQQSLELFNQASGARHTDMNRTRLAEPVNMDKEGNILKKEEVDVDESLKMEF